MSLFVNFFNYLQECLLEIKNYDNEKIPYIYIDNNDYMSIMVQ